MTSHWPFPEQFEATKRLVSGMFEAAPGVGVAGALRAAERRLMDAAETSHPHRWSAFAVVGNGAPLLLQK